MERAILENIKIKLGKISLIQTVLMGWGSQGKPWLDRKNPNTNKGRLGILYECNWKISFVPDEEV